MNQDNKAFEALFDSVEQLFRDEARSRPLAMDAATRALVTLAMVASRMQPEWMPEHVEACVVQGLGRTEIAEVLMQVYCYAGTYPALSGFRAAGKALADLEAKGRLTPAQAEVQDRKPSTDAHEARTARGLELRRQIFGADNIDPVLASDDAFQDMFNKLTHDFCFGNIWDRPALSWSLRSQLCLAIASSTGQIGAVERHVRSAVRNGVARQRIGEIFRLACAYGGAGHALASFEAAQRVFQQMAQEPAQQ